MINANVSRTLAEARAGRVSALKYDLHLSIPRNRDEPVHGRLKATFELSDAGTPLLFDFTQPTESLETVVANSDTISIAVSDGHVPIPAERLRRGVNTVLFAFHVTSGALNRQEEFLYSLFVPAHASSVLPCFDQPNLKARWRLSLSVPHGWSAVSNGQEISCATLPDALMVTFEETAPLPTYLFAVAAGRFLVETAERQRRRLRLFHCETDQTRLRENLPALMDLHADALTRLEAYTGIPYPFGKFDFVLIPSFQFGGMEHPGAVYYNAGAVLLDQTATQAQHLARANVIAHEVAHMWFGDLVTMTWFDDVWTKEVFAGFLADKVVHPAFPAVNHDLRFVWHHYPGAYDVDRTPGANPIRQPLENLRDAGSLYGPIIYQKAPIIMRQLEDRLGAERLRDGLGEYLTTHAFGNASWFDLLAILQRRSPEPLGTWSSTWVEQAGRPTIATDLRIVNDAIAELTFRQSDNRGRGLVWPQRIDVRLGYGSHVHRLIVDLVGADVSVAEASGLPVPDWILPAGTPPGYARFVLDGKTLDFVSGSLHRLPDPLTRGAALLLLWEAMLEGDARPRSVWRQLLTSLRQETDQLNIQQMLDYVRALFWRILSPQARQDGVADIEDVLRDGLARAVNASGKAAWFAALRSLALRPATIQWLVDVWRREAPIPGLALTASDETDLAFELALRHGSSAQEILRSQLDRLEDPERRARFLFVRPALSADSAVRSRCFESLRTPSNRAHEAWVLEAVRYLHHPLRAEVSDNQIVAALSLVREIHETGDIFFPRRWIEAVLSGCSRKSTALSVRRFIEDLPDDYPHRLRWTLLASADLLFRQLDGTLRSDPLES